MHYLSYHENKQHGTMEFPVAYYDINKNHPRYNMPFHWHKEWELIRILEGDFPLYVDGTGYLAHTGDILLLREGMLHGGTPHACAYQCFDFHLHGLFHDILSVKNYLRPFYQGKLLPFIHYPSYHSVIYPIVDELLSAFSRNLADGCQALLTLGNISRLFAAILQEGCYTENSEAASGTARKITQLKPVLEYIEANYQDSITLEELAGIAGMNPKYFCRFFNSIIQQTPMNYVNFYRIEQATNLLCSTSLSVTEIGLECGFNDTCHFVKTFKKHKGVTPKQYQKLNS